MVAHVPQAAAARYYELPWANLWLCSIARESYSSHIDCNSKRISMVTLGDAMVLASAISDVAVSNTEGKL